LRFQKSYRRHNRVSAGSGNEGIRFWYNYFGKSQFIWNHMREYPNLITWLIF